MRKTAQLFVYLAVAGIQIIGFLAAGVVGMLAAWLTIPFFAYVSGTLEALREEGIR